VWYSSIALLVGNLLNNFCIRNQWIGSHHAWNIGPYFNKRKHLHREAPLWQRYSQNFTPSKASVPFYLPVKPGIIITELSTVASKIFYVFIGRCKINSSISKIRTRGWQVPLHLSTCIIDAEISILMQIFVMIIVRRKPTVMESL